MSCEKDCPRIAAFNAQLSVLYDRVGMLDQQDEKLSKVAEDNEASRYQFTDIAQMPGRYDAMRALYDAEFHQKEAVGAVAAARAAIGEAIELTISAKDITLVACPASGPIDNGRLEPGCALDYFI